MINRSSYLANISYTFKVNRIVALLGPRQCGKTTLAKQFRESTSLKTHYFDLENPIDIEQLKNPILALKNREGLVIIDEIQRLPDLFPTLRYIHDENPALTFLILGSASRELIRQSSESLAGRIAYIEVTPFSLNEAGGIQPLQLRGGFPSSFTAEDDDLSFLWRRNYIRTYVEHDLPSLGFSSNPEVIQRFWSMLAHYHGQNFNASEIATSMMISRASVNHYLDILKGTFMIRVLQPWHENIKKRQVKTPKIYFRDSGLYHYFLNLKTIDELQNSPKLGASWEGFALENVIKAFNAIDTECFFWSVHNQAELDLLILKDGKRIGIEFKYVDAPKITKSMLIAMGDLKLDQLYVIYPGETNYALADTIMVKGLESFIPEEIV